MTLANALNLRRLGLAIEALCLLGVLSMARTPDAPRRSLLGIDQSQMLMGGIALGFAFWIAGTFTYYRLKRQMNANK